MTIWLQKLFLTVLQMSLTASFVCVIVCVLRLLLKKAPKIYVYALWAVVFIRFLCPVALDSPLSLVPQWEQLRETREDVEKDVLAGIYSYEMTEENSVETQEKTRETESAWRKNTAGDSLENSMISVDWTPSHADTADSGKAAAQNGAVEEEVSAVWSILWLTGMVGIGIWQGIRTCRWKTSLGRIHKVDERICTASGITAPFVMGFVHPHIYLPENMAEEEKGYVLLHEQIHIRRRDYQVKMIAFGIVCIHWFNPFAWLAFRLMCMDMEMSCDEEVIKKMKAAQKKEYASALLSFADRIVSGNSLAFGEPYAKKRIRNVLSYHHPAYRITLVLTVVCLALAGCLLTDPVNNGTKGNAKEEIITLPLEESAEETVKSGTEIIAPDIQELEAYIASYAVGSKEPIRTAYCYEWAADLNHDGQEEQILFDWGYFTTATSGMFAVLDTEGCVVYSSEVGYAHVGWQTFYLCEIDGQEYLLKYSPDCYQGICGYSYDLMELDQVGDVCEMCYVDSGYVEFYSYSGEYLKEEIPDRKMDIPAMAEFADRVNTYIENSYLLVSTNYDYLGVELPSGSSSDLFCFGTPEKTQQILESYNILIRENPEVSDLERVSDVKEKLTRWCDYYGIRYVGDEQDQEEEADQFDAYWQSYAVGKKDPIITEDSIIWKADLTHDGKEEQIVIDWGYLNLATFGMIAVLDEEGTILYVSDFAYAHAGNVTFYLCEKDGKDYLLKYVPWTGQGVCDFEYQLFYLTKEGEIQMEDEEDIEFYPGYGYDMLQQEEYPDWKMDIAAMVQFIDHVNGYIEDAFLLVSTDEGYTGSKLLYSMPGDLKKISETYGNYLGGWADSDAVPYNSIELEDTAEKLKAWCEAAGVPYKE